MSIADKITQLTQARNDIRAAIEAKGIPAGNKNFSDFAGLIQKLGGTIATTDFVAKRGEGDTLNHNLSQNVSVSNGETPSFALASGQTLPGGVILSADGILQGSPTAAGLYDFGVSVTAPGCAPATLRVVITVVEAGIITVSDQVVTGTKGEQVSHQLVATASNGEELEFLPYIGNDCPANLSCSPSGLITGIPAEAGNSKVQFYVSAIGCPYQLFFVDFTISEAATGGTETRTAKAFGHPTDAVARQFSAVLQKYTYTGTFTVGGETFPYYTGNGSTPWYLFGGKARGYNDNSYPLFYAVYLSSKNPTTISSWTGDEFTWYTGDDTRLIMVGGAVDSTGPAPTYSEVSSELSTTLLNSNKWWYGDDSDYPQTERADTITWE